MFGFGKDKDKEEQEKLGRTIANLSDQVGDLQQEAIAKNKQIEELKKQVEEAQAKAASGGAAAKAHEEAQKSSEMLLKEAQAQVHDLEKRIADMAKSKAAAEAKAAPVAEAVSNALGTVAAGGLAAGVTAWVQKAGGKSLRRRSAPGLESNVLDGLQPGTQLSLLEGPVAQDGHSWWRIRAEDGREGWVAGEELVTKPE